jgi:hypothetical protein
MSPEVLLIGIEASHSMTDDALGRSRFEESISYARDLSEDPSIFCFNSDWFMPGENVSETPLTGSGLLKAGLRGGLELASAHENVRLIIFTDGIGEPEVPKAEAGALANANVKLDIVFVGVDMDDLAILRTLADVAGGNAILLQEPEEEETPGKPAELVPSDGADEEQVIDIKPKRQEAPGENGVKGMINKIKEKVW